MLNRPVRRDGAQICEVRVLVDPVKVHALVGQVIVESFAVADELDHLQKGCMLCRDVAAWCISGDRRRVHDGHDE